MIYRLLKFLGIFIILLHFLGVTQYASSYAKNKSSFLSMMTMAEEENKKEKDDKDCSEDTKEFKNNSSFFLYGKFRISCLPGSTPLLEHYRQQYIADQLTPPPNSIS